MLVPAANLAPGVRGTLAISLRIPSGLAATALIRHRQQIRAFRFGLWFHYLDPEFHHDVRRRQRKLRSKLAETLNRRLSWEKNPYVEELKAERRRATTDYWYSRHHCHHRGRYVAGPASQQTPDNPTGERPGRNIEDAERGPMEHLLFGDRLNNDSYIYDHWSSPLHNIKEYIAQQRDQILKPWSSAAPASPSSASASGTFVEPDRVVQQDNVSPEYVIDPITNRKVSKSTSPLPKSTLHDAPVEIPVKTFKSGNPHCMPCQPASAKTMNQTKTNAEPQTANKSQRSDTGTTTKAENKGTRAVEEGNDYIQNPRYNHAANISTIFGDNFVTWKYKGIFWQKDDKSPFGSAEAAQTAQTPPPAEKNDLRNSARDKEVIFEAPSTPLRDERTTIKPEPERKAVKDLAEDAGGEAIAAEELAKYQSFQDLEPDNASSAVAENEATSDHPSAYQAVSYLEPDGKMAAEAEDFPQSPDELGKYQAFRYQEPDGLPPMATEEGQSDPNELRMYDLPIDLDEPIGKESSGEEAESTEAQSLENLRASDIRAAVGQSQSDNRPEKSNYRKIMESLMPTYDPLSDEGLRDSSTMMNRSTDHGIAGEEAGKPDVKKWTGNYARDFPEEFQRTWSTKNSASKANLYPDSIESPSEAQESLFANADTKGDGARLQPALDRQRLASRLERSEGSKSDQTQVGGDGYSQTPQGLETSYNPDSADEKARPTFVKVYNDSREFKSHSDAGDQKAHDKKLVQEIKQIYEDAYGPIDLDKVQMKPGATPSSSLPKSDPMVYKILAYDPTMQAINIAETTSIVNDGATPLTPAEVLLRLSNPAKFFPHFAPLRAEGYEIVSGSGDVLVFRKVREAVPSASATASTAKGSKPTSGDDKSAPVATQQQGTPAATTSSGRVNPIDLTGRTHFPPPPSNPAWNFASPTGYVNYDPPPLERPSPPFRSNIDVRREEPVFSGRKTESEDGPKQRKSVGKRMLVGAAWVAGVSYALGVVGEYFKTGGVDGMGPKGL